MRDALMTYRKSPKGVLTNIYQKQKERSKKKGMHPPTYTLQEFHEMFLNDPKFIALYFNWINNGCQYYDKPSIDRKDPNRGYTHDNIQLLTWRENREKGDKENAQRFTTPIIMLDREGHKIREFESIKEAVAETGFSQGLIVMCCQGKRNHTGGYQFQYSGDRFRKKASTDV